MVSGRKHLSTTSSLIPSNTQIINSRKAATVLGQQHCGLSFFKFCRATSAVKKKEVRKGMCEIETDV